MQRSAGSRFGPYEILALLGEGGMGAVYRATDLRLNRDVALKILPSTGSDPDDQLLLLEEARAAGALAHPNVVTVYDFGLEGATPYLVAELIDGRPLRAEIDRGIVPLKRLLDLAAQIAAGLSAAHARGIAHLDLKPENVMVTPDGRAKIVDFGLAQFFNERARRPNATTGESQTETLPMTGTAPYMSPEQARGGAGDFRSDQFSFGLILYELATGIHPLRCATVAETLAAIVETEPRPIAERNPKVPVPLRWIVERCLAKDPAERYASTADLARDLAVLRDRVSEVASTGAAGPTAVASSRRLAVYGTAAALTVIVAAGAFMIRGAPAPVSPVPIPVVTYTSYQGAPAWSPDGKTLAYVAQVGGVLQIFTRTLSSPSPEEVTTGLFDCTDPFWSQDGSRIYFHSQAEESDSLWSVPATGGRPVLLIKNASRAALSPDGQTLVFSRLSDGWPVRQSLWVAAASGRDAHRFSRGPFADAVINGSWFRFSPDGSKLLAWTYLTPEAGASRSRFWIVPWPDGEPYEVLQSLGGRGLAGVAFDWMPDNQRVVIAVADQHSSSTSTHLWIADVLNDRLEPLTTTLGMENYPAVTRDGARVAFTSEAVDFNLIEIPLNGLPPREILATSRSEMDPAWSARNSQYAFVSDRTGTLEIILSTPDRAFERSLLNSSHFSEDRTRAIGSLAFSPDGLRLAYQRLGDTSGYQVWISSVSGAGPATALAPGFGYQDAPSWSPDGSELALTVAPHGKWALATAKIGAGTAPRVILEDVVPYSRPAWSPDGRWILCEGVDGLMLVSPDGRQTHTISDYPWLATAWNSDGTLVYGLREAATPKHFMLVAVDPATTSERVINPDLGVIPPANQPIRGLSRIGTTGLLTSIARARSDIWMFDGFLRPEGLAARIRRTLAGKRR